MITPTRNTVLVRYTVGNRHPEFWTGSGWSREYPNARLLTERDAESRVLMPNESAIVDYGLVTEHTLGDP